MIDDLVDLLNAHDLPEAQLALDAWWEPLPDGGHACGMVVRLDGGTVYYLEALRFGDEDATYATPRRLTRPTRPKPKLYETALDWESVDLQLLNDTLDEVFCRV